MCNYMCVHTFNTYSILIFCLELKSPKKLLNPLAAALDPEYCKLIIDCTKIDPTKCPFTCAHMPEEPDWCKEAVDCAKPGAVQTCPVTCSATGKGNDIMLNKESFSNNFIQTM